MQIYQELARKTGALKRCEASGNQEWFDRWTVENFPHGSGFDSGVKFDFDNSTGERLIFHTSFHHMNENGMYDGWTSHTVTVSPSLEFGYQIRVSGRNKNDIKDYIAEVFREVLDSKQGKAS